jgi:hypothetical protein
MTMTTTFAGEEVAASTATTQGVYDYAAHKGQMDTTIKSAGLPFRMTMRTLVIGSTTYLRMPDMPQGAGPRSATRRPWDPGGAPQAVDQAGTPQGARRREPVRPGPRPDSR